MEAVMLLTNLLALFIVFAVFQQPAFAIKKSYVVYLGGHSHGADVTTADLDRVTEAHTGLLASFVGSEEKAKDAMFYSYRKHINGFAALVEEEEAAQIAEHPDVVSVFENVGMKLHTTHSWEFLMLERDGVIHPSSAWNKARFGEDTIIATLDTGVWPESKSFSGEGYGPIPSRWKGTCEVDNNTVPFCNRKLIGARYFNKGFSAATGKPLNSSFYTPRDYLGHGSHTLSTAAGNFVPGASLFGVGNGTAKGGSPRARAAMYKVCWSEEDCYDADILAAFDAAIEDGVDVLSVSLGGGEPREFFYDSLAIGAYHAVKNGVTVVASAGNSGPFPGTVSNTAPWIVTVAASSVDREFQANVELKNASVFKGTSFSMPLPNGGFYPLINSVDARAANVSIENATLCHNGTLDGTKVKGKIVVCLRGDIARVEKGIEAARAGAAGMIIANDESSGSDTMADPHVLPATNINYTDGLVLFAYINSTKNPQGLIRPPKAVVNTKPAPVMTIFSSRGPCIINPQILKPDVTAPGELIMAAYSEAVSATGEDWDKRTIPFNFLSGTSMSCPHVSGVAGLLKTLHPDWSPSAIKSAIMTTARTRDNTGSPLRNYFFNKTDPYAYGSGHIRPNRAMDPGLVYDLSANDYLDYLCGRGYNKTMIAKFSGSDYRCPEKYDVLDFNYPSISVLYINETATVTRKVKNVGRAGTYVSRVQQPLDYSVSVEPEVLRFERTGEEKSFKVMIKEAKPRGEIESDFKYGKLIWSDGSHFVRSPIVILPTPNK